MRDVYAGVVARAGAAALGCWCRPIVVVAGLVIWLAGGQLGTRDLPQGGRRPVPAAPAGPTGTRIEQTEEIAVKALEVIKEKVGPENVAISLGYVGVVPSSYPINSVYLWMGGPEEAVLRVALKHDSGVRIEELKEQLRKELPRRLEEWLRPKLVAEGFTPTEIDERVARPEALVRAGRHRQRGDELRLADADRGRRQRPEARRQPRLRREGPGGAGRRSRRCATCSSAQSLDYPTVEVKIDRELAGRSGVTAEDVARSLVAATSSSRFVVPNYWRDPKSGIGYQVQVEIPDRADELAQGDRPGARSSTSGDGQLLLQDVAEIEEGTMPGEYDRYNMRRLVSLTANIQGEDLGPRGRRSIDAGAEGAAGEPPRGVQVDVRGQVEPMKQMFRGAGAIGPGAWRSRWSHLPAADRLLPVAAAGAGGRCRRCRRCWPASRWRCWSTGTTLNIQSFMGAIMAIGVAVANAILLVTFAERARRGGEPAREAARGRRAATGCGRS